jgi:hypothetical protein
MVQPSKEDIKKRQQKLDKLLRSLNEDGSMPESKVCTQLRSAIRKVWFMHDVKVSYILKNSYPDMEDGTRTKWLIDCECCGKPFKTSDIEVDHINGENSLKTLDDLVDFAKSILGVSHEDLRVLCSECHAAITYAARYGVTFEQAIKEKVVISKIKQTVVIQKKELAKFGYTSNQTTNEEKRRSCYRELLEKGLI